MDRDFSAIDLGSNLGSCLSIGLVAVAACQRNGNQERSGKEGERFLKAVGVHREESLISEFYDGRKSIVGSQDVKKIKEKMLGDILIATT